MKFCRLCVLSAALVFLFGAMANAMTPEEFFAHKSENLKLATYVLGQSEAGGVQGQLERAKGAIALAGKETNPSKKEVAAKLAWFYAVHSAYLADTAVPKAEAGPYQKAAVQALIGASQALGVPQPGLEKLMTGTVQLLGEAEKKMVEGAIELEQAASDSKPAQPKDKPRSEEQKIAALLQIAQTVKARLEKPAGKAYPMFIDDMAFADFNQALFGALAPEMGDIQGDKEGIRTFLAFADAWRKLGYAFDATILKTYSGISPDRYMWLGSTRRAETFLPLIMILNDENVLKKALAEGVVSRASVVAYLESTLEFMHSIQ